MKKLQLRFIHRSCSVLLELIVFDKLAKLDLLNPKLADFCLQGIISGINAARHSDGKSLIILERESSYIGTLIDDLVTKDLREPYRMLTRYIISVETTLIIDS